MARFWAELLAREIVEDDEGVMLPGDERQVGLRFVNATTAKVGRNRLHLHVTSATPEEQQETVERALRCGGPTSTSASCARKGTSC